MTPDQIDMLMIGDLVNIRTTEGSDVMLHITFIDNQPTRVIYGTAFWEGNRVTQEAVFEHQLIAYKGRSGYSPSAATLH